MAYEWIRTRGTAIPPNAFVGGYDGKMELFVARARNPRDDRMTGGKAAIELSACHISYGKDEIIVPEYEVLTVPPEHRKNLVWEICKDGKLPERAIPTDYEAKLYVARLAHNSTLTPGKFQDGLPYGYIGYGGAAIHSSSYEVLCYYH